MISIGTHEVMVLVARILKEGRAVVHDDERTNVAHT